MPNTENIQYTKNTKYKSKLLTVEWHKEAADQSSENCKLQNIQKKNERK